MKKVRCKICNQVLFKNQRNAHARKHIGVGSKVKWPKETLDFVFKEIVG